VEESNFLAKATKKSRLSSVKGIVLYKMISAIVKGYFLEPFFSWKQEN